MQTLQGFGKMFLTFFGGCQTSSWPETRGALAIALPDYDFAPFFSTIRTTHSGMEEEGLFCCNCRCQVPGSSLKEAQYVNDGGLVSLISRPHPEWECLRFGGHSDCLLLRSIANSAGLRQDVSHILWRMPNVKLTRDKRRFGNCTSKLWLCTFLLNNQDNTLWHGRGGLIFLQLSMLSSARLSFEGSLVRKWWRSCKPNQQTPPGMGMFAIWRPQRLLISSQHCKLCRASARCFSHSLEDAKRQVDPRQEALWQLHFQIMTLYLSSQQSGQHTLAWKRRASFSATVDVVKCQALVWRKLST